MGRDSNTMDEDLFCQGFESFLEDLEYWPWNVSLEEFEQSTAGTFSRSCGTESVSEMDSWIELDATDHEDSASQLQLQLPPTNILMIQEKQHLDSNSSPDPSTSPMEMRSMASNYVYNHRIAERNRRYREKGLREYLAKLIPRKILKKKDKISVLQASIVYIRELLSTIEAQQRSIEFRQQQTKSESLPPLEFEFCSPPNPMDDEVIMKNSMASDSATGCFTIGNGLTIQEDGDIFKVYLNTSSPSNAGNKLLIDLVDSLQDMGIMKIDSIIWKPETCPMHYYE